jgi:hypothetical protein
MFYPLEVLHRGTVPATKADQGLQAGGRASLPLGSPADLIFRWQNGVLITTVPPPPHPAK